MIIGIDHGYYAIKTRHCSFPAGLTCYGSHEPYTRQSVLEVDGQFYVCGTGRQPVRCDKTENDTYYLLTLAALAQEIKMRGAPNESSVKIAAGLPLTSFGRDKPKFRQYLLRSQPVLFRFEGTEYKIAVEDVALFPQGYAALLTDPDLLLDEPSLTISEKQTPPTCPTSTCSAADFLARASALPEAAADSTTQGAPCSLSLPDWLKPGTLSTGWLKMFPACSTMTAGGHLRPSCAKWKSWGILSNGRFLTAQISVYRRQESACTLSDILMNDVEEKYFLSPREQALLLYSPGQPKPPRRSNARPKKATRPPASATAST